MKCSSTHLSAIKAAEAFPGRLQEVHQGRIVLRPNAVYHGTHKHIAVLCTVCGHEWEPQPNDLVNSAKGCPKCSAKRRSDSAGSLRTPRATEAEKQKARDLRASGMTYTSIAAELGRSLNGVATWCDSELAERERLRRSKWREQNRERHRANTRRYLKEFEHGRAVARKSSANRRKRKRGETEWIDEVNGLVNLLHVPATGSDLTKEQQVYIECERLTKETGIEHHVDHIKPLCLDGEHIWWNLQVITAEENLAKGGKYRPQDKALYEARIALLFLIDD